MIIANNLSKTFKLYRSPAHRLKEIIFRKKYHKRYEALNNVSFHVAGGQTLGIVGPNGAGKSTLLKLITGILLPDQGDIQINGRITGLLELGTGFNPNLTGRQNIAMNGLLLGMSSEEVKLKEPQVIDFAELGIFIDEPLSTYSSGMVMRLAFAVAINADPNCFIIDEALSVGDAGFQQKCMRRITQFKEQGGAIIFVSHDMNAIKQLCDHALLLNNGQVEASGTPNMIVNKYKQLLTSKNHSTDEFHVEQTKPASYGTLETIIKQISINGLNHKPTLLSGEQATIVVEIESQIDRANLTCGIAIRDSYGQDIFGTNTYHHQQTLTLTKFSTTFIEFELYMNVGVGKYTVSAAIHNIPTMPEYVLNWHDDMFEFTVISPKQNYFEGICRLQPTITIKQHQLECQVAPHR